MQLSEYLQAELHLSKKKSQEIVEAVGKYRQKYRKSGKERKKLNIKVPQYTLGEEIFNSISHGFGAAFAIVALVLMTVKARGALAETCVSLFGATMIVLYTISCIYHALSARLEGKRSYACSIIAMCIYWSLEPIFRWRYLVLGAGWAGFYLA